MISSFTSFTSFTTYITIKTTSRRILTCLISNNNRRVTYRFRFFTNSNIISSISLSIMTNTCITCTSSIIFSRLISNICILTCISTTWWITWFKSNICVIMCWIIKSRSATYNRIICSSNIFLSCFYSYKYISWSICAFKSWFKSNKNIWITTSIILTSSNT